MIGLFSFFAGAGFLDLGFERTDNFKTVFVNEIHKPFMQIYKHSRKLMNIGKPDYGYSQADIRSFLTNRKLNGLINKINHARTNFELVGFIGGPPCPDFSVGGKNRGKDGENGKLSQTYVDLICKIQPDFFLFENVKGLYRTAKHRFFFDGIKKQLQDSGYSLSERLINAIEYGAPQDRERIILIGFHNNVIEAKHLKVLENKQLDFNWDSNKQYNLEEVFKKNWPGITSYTENSEANMPDNIFKELTVEYWFEKNGVETHINKDRYFTPKTGLPRFQTIYEGDDKKKSYKRLHRWRYSPTAAYGNNEVHLHPYKSRRISAAEALAIQSLPREFAVPNILTLSDTFKAIGNGVPYLAARGLALSLYDYIENERTL